MNIKEKYVQIHKQGFVPILVNDNFDAVFLADACVEAGIKTIEITCRRNNVVDEIKAIKDQHPSLGIIVGSTIDDDEMVAYIRKQKMDFPSLEQLTELGVDGLVSQAMYQVETVKRYSKKFLVVPGVETLGEALTMIKSGAQFAKFFALSISGGPAYLKCITGPAVHQLPAVFVTGGVTQTKIPEYIKANAALLASGFDVIVKNQYQALQEKPDMGAIVKTLRSFLDAAQLARSQYMPELFARRDSSCQQYLDAIPHYHPFH